MITYSNDSAILSFLMGKLYGCKDLIAGESATVQMWSLFFCLLCVCKPVHESWVIHSTGTAYQMACKPFTGVALPVSNMANI